ncbi:MAG: hypothetical protein AAGC53_15860 [Actinomycetota bacterium]
MATSGFSEALEQATHDNAEVRTAGQRTLQSLAVHELAVDEILQLLQAVRDRHRALEPGPARPDDTLIRLLWTDLPALDSDWVTAHIDEFGPDLHPSLIRMLAHQTAATAQVALNRLLMRSSIQQTGAAWWPVLLPLTNRRVDPNLVLDGVLSVLTLDGWSWSAANAVLAWAHDDRLSAPAQRHVAAVAEPFASTLLDRAAEQIAATTPQQRRNDDDFEQLRGLTGLLLDLLGRLPAVGPGAALRHAAALDEPWLALWAVRPLAGTPAAVDDAAIARIAADPETRLPLLSELSLTDETARVPAQFRTQAAIAEADMVRWLAYPAELGRAPDDIDLITRTALDDAGRPADLFVFKFRTHEPHWAAEKGWMVGTSGPYPQTGSPSLTAGAMTFSTFARVDEKPIDDLVDDIIETLRSWRESPRS